MIEAQAAANPRLKNRDMDRLIHVLTIYVDSTTRDAGASDPVPGSNRAALGKQWPITWLADRCPRNTYVPRY